MLKTYISAKIHGMSVTHKSLNYNGSASIPRALMDAAGIEEFEQVHMVNKANGNRWVTYAIVGNDGELRLNGAAARMGEVGDEILIFTYRLEERFTGAKVIFIDPRTNAVREIAEYKSSE